MKITEIVVAETSGVQLSQPPYDHAAIRRHRATAALVVLLSVATAAPSPPTSVQIAASKQHSRSEVHLLGVSHVPQSVLKTAAPAEDGLRLVFLVASRLPGDAELTFRELRDFTVNDQSYRSMSIARLGKAIEPGTEVVNPSTLTERDATVHKLVPPGPFDSIGMIVDIAGAKLPASGVARLRLQVGWNDRLEDFEFEFDLAKVPAETAFSQNKSAK
jgi:hypothetical protein